MGVMKTHPYAELFPLLDDAEMRKLADDIKTNGQQVPAILDQHERLVDGRNRMIACEMAGVELITEVREYKSEREVLKAIISLNDVRRHLTTSQRAMIAAGIANMPHGGQIPRNGPTAVKGSLNLDIPSPNQPPPVSVAQAAEMLKVSPATVAQAKKVKDGDSPQIQKLQKAVIDGHIAVSKAAQIVNLPADKDREEAIESAINNKGKRARLPSVPKPAKSAAVLWQEKIEAVLKLILGAMEEYKSIKKMFKSADWKTSTKADKKILVEMTIALSVELAKVVSEMDSISL